MIGRPAFDNWMIGYALSQKESTLLVDATFYLELIHINHKKLPNSPKDDVTLQFQENRRLEESIYSAGLMSNLDYSLSTKSSCGNIFTPRHHLDRKRVV